MTASHRMSPIGSLSKTTSQRVVDQTRDLSLGNKVTRKVTRMG